MNSENAKVLYLRWLSKAEPTLFARAAATANGQLSDIEEGLGGWVDTIVGAVVTIGGTLIQKKQIDAQTEAQKAKIASDAAAADAARKQQLQIALLQTNTQRAAQGLPPVDINGRVIPSSALPQLPAMVGAPTSAYYMSQPESFFDSVPTWAYFAAGGVVLLLLMRR